ncbi:MAG: YCF48-related protein, partial [bacterium]
MPKKITFTLMIVLLISVTSYSQDKQDWKYMHPTPQANLIRKAKMITETNWVGNGGNGLFQHTSNSGVNWYFQYNAGRVNPSTLATPQSYDNWFFNANTGIVVGDQGYVGRTTKGGVVFDEVAAGLIATNSRCWSVWFADANTGYVGAGSQNGFTTNILKTTNGGVNWTTVYSDLSGSTSYLTSLGGADANTVCAAWQNGSCVRTTDGGSTWNIIPGQFPSIMNSISFLNSTTGFAAGGAGSFARTINGGLNWTALSTPTVDWSYFQVKVVSATEIYVVGDPTALYKTTDFGDTWSTLPISVSGPAATFVWYSLDHFGSTYILSGDYGIVAKSIDGCATWTAPGYFQLSNRFSSDITTVPGTSKYWTVAGAFPFGSSNKQVFYSSNSGTNWTTYDVGVPGDFYSISMINENTGYISGQNNQMMKTTTGGTTWFAKTGPSPLASSQLNTCEFINENTGWVFVNFSTVAGGNVFKTIDGGDSWTQYTTGAASEQIYSADMVDANTGFCVMNQSNRPIYRTNDGGATWTGATTTGFTGSIHGISSPDGNTVYACQSGGTSRVAKSVNGGVNWSLITLPVAVDCNSIDFKDVNTGYVSGNSSAIVCRTSNGGASWTYQNTHNITLTKVFVSQGDTAWVTGGNGAIIRYTGISTPINLNLSVLLEGMYDQVLNQMSRVNTVKVYLRGAASPYAIKDSASAAIDSLTFSGLFTFANAPSGTYYLDVRYFNTIETWSKAGGEIYVADGSTYDYDFTNLSSKAFGNNMTLKGTKWS